MVEDERMLIQQLIKKSISKEYFLERFTQDILKNPKYIKQLLEVAYEEENALDIDYLIYIGLTFEVFTEDYSDLLCKLIESPWHEQHESIAGIFQYLKSSKSVDSLYKTAMTQYEYLDYDDSYALAVKCIWALGAIGTKEAYHSLKELSKSDNKIIAENAKNQLKRLEEKGLLK